MSDDPPIRRNCDVMRYLGRPWSPEHDCADLVVDVAREQLGVQVALPGRAASQRGYEVTGVYRWKDLAR